eukprot:879540-Prorocentrum_minimum.AAC.1
MPEVTNLDGVSKSPLYQKPIIPHHHRPSPPDTRTGSAQAYQSQSYTPTHVYSSASGHRLIYVTGAWASVGQALCPLPPPAPCTARMSAIAHI